MRTRYYLIIGIIAYLAFLVTTIPAAPVIGMLDQKLPVTINNVSGTLWNGRAGKINARQNITLTDVEWSFLPWRLLLASAAIDVDARFNDNPLSTRLSTGISGNLAIDDLAMNLDASDISPLIALPIGELSGQLQLNINSARLKQSEVPRVDGSINWQKAAVTIAETADLGNISIQVQEDDQSPLTANISNTGGHLSLKGVLTTTEQGDYSLRVTMKPNANASDNLTSSLGMFSKKQRNGEFLMNNKGNLKQLGLM
ncbi:MAG: type II secretion system protein N [Thiotrichales bacterium]|nr:MAG: type II secretion system protein N [Thiotrichales bacterium]